MMAKPMKTRELHDPMIQFLIKGFIPLNSVNRITFKTLQNDIQSDYFIVSA